MCTFIFLRLERSGTTSCEIITIARQFGSGGHEAVQRLLEQLGIPLYDRSLVEIAAQQMGHSPVGVEKADESALSPFLTVYQTPKEPNPVTRYGLSLNDSTYVIQTIIIEALTRKGSCIIVGRCDNYMLRSYPDLIDVSTYADTRDRVRWIIGRYSFSEKDAVNAIKSMGRQRRNHYENYTKRKWGSAECHQMFLSISKLGMDRIVRVIRGTYKTS